MASNTVLRIMFMTLIVFSVGLIAGFNIKDLIIKTCGRVVATTNVVCHCPPANETFTRLPDKFLANIPMKAPATRFFLRPWRVLEATRNYSGKGHRPYFIISLVKSAVTFASRRSLIRQTWGSMSRIEGEKLSVIFVLGMATSPVQQQFLEEENALYGDTIQGDVVDTYRNLPTKVLSGYQFVVEYLGNASDFYISTDDDCFLNMPNTFEYLSHVDPSRKEAMYCGFLYHRNGKRMINPRSKFKVSEEIYPMRLYPIFCHGGMTIIPFNLLRDIYRVSLVTNYTGFHLEDVLTNGILREKLEPGGENIRPVILRDRKTNRRLGLMWHLGDKKDKKVAFNGLWNTMKRRFAVYKGPLDIERGYRAIASPILTLEGKSVEETTKYFERIAQVEKGVTDQMTAQDVS